MKYFRFKKQKKITKVEISILFGLISAILMSFFGCLNQTENLEKNVLRLHILANSNSKEDQAVKLKVRDEILKNFNFNSYNNNIEKSKQKIKNELKQIENVAKKTLEKEGFKENVKAKLEKTYFNTREYENFSMPAGVYDALKIEIGNAKGKNWWCVMVPSMCVPAALEKQKAINTFNENEKDLITKGNKTEIRFKSIEIFKNIFSLRR